MEKDGNCLDLKREMNYSRALESYLGIIVWYVRAGRRRRRRHGEYVIFTTFTLGHGARGK